MRLPPGKGNSQYSGQLDYAIRQSRAGPLRSVPEEDPVVAAVLISELSEMNRHNGCGIATPAGASPGTETEVGISAAPEGVALP